jgi:hypothetical protein
MGKSMTSEVKSFQKRIWDMLSTNYKVGFKGRMTTDAGFFYAPHVPNFMMGDNDIIIKTGYRGEWVIEVPYHLYYKVVAWCHEAFGDDGNKRTYRWRRNWTEKKRIFLRHESDLVLFRLKWGEHVKS